MRPHNLLESVGGEYKPFRDFAIPMYIIMIENYSEGLVVPLNVINRLADIRIPGRQKVRPKNLFRIQHGDDVIVFKGITLFTKQEAMEMILKIYDEKIEGLEVAPYQITKDCIVGYHDELKYHYILNTIKINYTDRRIWKRKNNRLMER